MKLVIDQSFVSKRPDGSANVDFFGGRLWLPSAVASSLKDGSQALTLDVSLYPVQYTGRDGKARSVNAIAIRGLAI